MSGYGLTQFRGARLTDRLARLTAQSGSFYEEMSNEYVAYGTLPDREHWMAITVQPRRDSVAVIGGSLALGLLAVACALFITMSAFFRLRLLVLIDSLASRIRRLGAGARCIADSTEI